MFAFEDPDSCGVIVLDPMCHITQGVGNIYESVLFSIADALIGSALGLLDVVWGLIETTTTPNLTAGYVYEWAGRMFAISLVVIVGFLVLQVATSLLRFRSPAAAATALPRAGAAVLGTAVSLPIIAALSRGSDALSRDLSGLGSGNLDTMGDSIATAISHWLSSPEGFKATAFATALAPGFGPTGAALVAIILVFLIVLGLFLVWAALLIRSMLLIISVVLAPIAIMGVGWEATQNWFRTWAAATVALVITKPVIVVVFGLGTSAMNALPSTDNASAALGQLFTAALMLALAGLSPLAAFRLVDFLGEQAVAGQHMGAAAAGAAIASKPAAAVKIPMQAAGMAAGVAGGAGIAGIAAGGSSITGAGSSGAGILSDPAQNTSPAGDTKPSAATPRPADPGGATGGGAQGFGSSGDPAPTPTPPAPESVTPRAAPQESTPAVAPSSKPTETS